MPGQTTPLPRETHTSLLLIILKCFRGVRGLGPTAVVLFTVKLTCMWLGNSCLLKSLSNTRKSMSYILFRKRFSEHN